MGASSLASFIGRLRRLVEPRCGGLDDGELLERFARRRDEAAFEVLLWRYGPLVLGVCRRMLRREQDVEDAFQATFLTLVRRAGSITRREALGGWLHQVAYRIGLRALARAGRGGIVDQGRVESAVARGEPEVDGEWREVLDQEVQRLPRRYRTPFILCYLEGKSQSEAARLLACPPGTVASRLAWARQRLRVRLAARGLTLPAALTGLVIPVEVQAASLTVLIAGALWTARLVATGTLAGSGLIPAHVTAWSKGVVRAMFLRRIQMAAILVLAPVLVGAGGGMVWQRVRAGGTDHALADGPPAQAAAPGHQIPAKAPPPAEPKRAAGEEKDTQRLQMELADADAAYQRLEADWDQRIARVRLAVREQERAHRQEKARLAFEAKRISRALEMAEARYERLTQALDKADYGSLGLDNMQKKQQETQKQAEQLSAKLQEYELKLAEMDGQLDGEQRRIESLERQRALELGRARKRVEAIERKMFPDAAGGTDVRLGELERKVSALARTVEDLRKALGR